MGKKGGSDTEAKKIDDAEVVSEEVREREAPPPRDAVLEPIPLASAMGGFDEPVREAPKASTGFFGEEEASASESTSAQKGKKKRKNAKPTPEEEAEKADQKQREALALVRMLDGMSQAAFKAKWGKVLDPVQLQSVMEQIAMTETEMESIAEPLAEGMLEHGLEMPWEVRLLLAGGAFVLPRFMLMKELEAHAAERARR